MSGPKLNTPPGFPTSGTRKCFTENPGLIDATLFGSAVSSDMINSCISLVSLVGSICSVMTAVASPVHTFTLTALQCLQQNITKYQLTH